MKTLLHILLDMDAVCTDFVGSALQLFNPLFEGKSLTEIDLQLAIDIPYVECLSKFDWLNHETPGTSIKDTTEIINKVDEVGIEFWSEMAPTPFSPLKIVEEYIKKTNCKLYFVTNPSNFAYSCEGKKKWLEKNVSVPYGVVLTKDKHLLANIPDSLLIDDNWNNLTKFTECGGNVFMYNGYFEAHLDHLKLRLKQEMLSNGNFN